MRTAAAGLGQGVDTHATFNDLMIHSIIDSLSKKFKNTQILISVVSGIKKKKCSQSNIIQFIRKLDLFRFFNTL